MRFHLILLLSFALAFVGCAEKEEAAAEIETIADANLENAKSLVDHLLTQLKQIHVEIKQIIDEPVGGGQS